MRTQFRVTFEGFNTTKSFTRFKLVAAGSVADELKRAIMDSLRGRPVNIYCVIERGSDVEEPKEAS